MPRRPVIKYQGRHEFPVPPSALWEILQEVDQYETWWPWLDELHVEGGSLRTGAVLSGVVAPPLPYRMRVEVVLTECEPLHCIEALVHGDLEGKATLEMRPRGAGVEIDVAWAVEMMQAPMRLADRLAHPLLQWGHDRVVDLTVAGFRKRLMSSA